MFQFRQSIFVPEKTQSGIDFSLLHKVCRVCDVAWRRNAGHGLYTTLGTEYLMQRDKPFNNRRNKHFP